MMLEFEIKMFLPKEFLCLLKYKKLLLKELQKVCL